MRIFPKSHNFKFGDLIRLTKASKTNLKYASFFDVDYNYKGIPEIDIKLIGFIKQNKTCIYLGQHESGWQKIFTKGQIGYVNRYSISNYFTKL